MYGDNLSEAADPVGLAPPRYCPRCDRGVEAGKLLCAVCGETLREQAFCPVCEHYWKLPVGSDCPKHDIPLEDQAPIPVTGPGKGEAIRWVIVSSYAEALQADAPRLRLEAEGVPTFLEGERMGRNTIYQVATGGVKLLVPEANLADARVLLSQTWTTPAGPDDLDDAWDELAPAPWEKRRHVMKAVILLMLFGPMVLSLIGALLYSLS